MKKRLTRASNTIVLGNSRHHFGNRLNNHSGSSILQSWSVDFEKQILVMEPGFGSKQLFQSVNV